MEEQIEEKDMLSDDTKTSFNKNFSERSEVAQEVISQKSGFIEKWSLLVFLLLLLSLVAATWFIKYPDTIEGTAVLTGENAPKEIIPKQSGKLIALFSKNNQLVKEGEIIAWLESNADIKEVIDLSGRLKRSIAIVASGDAASIAQLFDTRYVNLGELQTAYQGFVTSLQQYNDYLVNGFYYKRKNMLHGDIASLSNMKSKVDMQRSLARKDNELARKSFEMNERLYKEQVISAEEYRQAQSKLLNNEKSIPQTDVTVISQESQIRDKQKEIDQLDHDILQQQKIFEQSLHTLKSSVDDWLRRYTLQAPADGQVVFVLPLQKNQHIDQGKLLGYVNPPDTKYYAEVRLAQNNFGKIDTGMKVQLRFEAYPYQEMGFVPGKLNYISKVAIDSGFLGTVALDNGLMTNQHKSIQYKNGLKARAVIITKDMRLLERLYYSIVKATSVNK